VNKEDFVGQLRLVETEDFCRNFQSKPVIDRPTVKQPTDSNIRFIPLTKGKIAIVDSKDYEWLSKYKWYANEKVNGFYACRHKNGKITYMHREITKAPKNLVVDHIDHNTLNNRRSNLRVCTVVENLFNCRGSRKTSKYKGVFRHKKMKKWRSAIGHNHKYMEIGYFDNEVEAAKAYDREAAKSFGEFAYLNFPDEINSAKEKGL